MREGRVRKVLIVAVVKVGDREIPSCSARARSTIHTLKVNRMSEGGEAIAGQVGRDDQEYVILT